MSNKILHLDVNDVVLAVQLPEDRAVVLYGVRQVEVPLDAPFGVGDVYAPLPAEPVPTTKAGRKATAVSTESAE